MRGTMYAFCEKREGGETTIKQQTKKKERKTVPSQVALVLL